MGSSLGQAWVLAGFLAFPCLGCSPSGALPSSLFRLPLTFQAGQVHQALALRVPAGSQAGSPARVIVPLTLPVGVVVLAKQGWGVQGGTA